MPPDAPANFPYLHRKVNLYADITPGPLAEMTIVVVEYVLIY